MDIVTTFLYITPELVFVVISLYLNEHNISILNYTFELVAWNSFQNSSSSLHYYSTQDSNIPHTLIWDLTPTQIY